MKLNREQAEIIMTALNNYRGELYINDNDTDTLAKVSDLIRDIEDTMESKDIGQKRIPIEDGDIEVGSETGIEEDYNKLTSYPESIPGECD
jgi:hypothetical protein